MSSSGIFGVEETKMHERFCPKTGDITLSVTPAEVEQLKRSEGITPILTAGGENGVFHLMHSRNTRGEIEVREPRSPDFPYWYIKMNDQSYQALQRDRCCGSRYGTGSKVNILVIDEDDVFPSSR